MKTSSGLLLGVLFTLVVVIVAVVIYFNTRPEEKTKTSTGPSSTLPSIGDFTIAQTLSPNSDSETYTIEPYTIEYAEGDNEKSLSKNVTFTLNWKNSGNFETVSKIRVEHYIREKGTTAALQTIEVNNNQKLDGYWDYAPISVKISGLPDDNDNQYSFVGDNMFKVIATYDGNQELPLYDGTKVLGAGETHPPELVIKPGDLTATIDMTGKKTVTFNVSILGNTRGTTKDIVNKSYTFTATSMEDDITGIRTSVSIKGIELIAQDNTGKNFKFRYKADGKFVGAKRTNIVGTSDWFLELAKVDDVLETDDDKAVIITFSNSYLDKSGDETPGDTYRMLRITAKTCRTDPDSCLGEDETVDKTTTEDLFLYGSHLAVATNGTPKPAKWLSLTGRTKEETPMKHWKLEETTT